MPNFSKEWLANYERKRANQAGGISSGAKPEQAVRDEPLAAIPRKNGNGQRYSICITSHRRRLLDPDNLCGKWIVDALRHAGIIPDDTAAIVDYTIRQEKTEKADSERTEVIIQPLPTTDAP